MATRKIGISELLNAVYDRIDTHALTSSYRVYNHIPPDVAFPYVSIGPSTGGRSGPFGTQDIEAEDNSIYVHVWSDYYGDKEAAEMLDNVCQAITSSALSITGYTSVLMLLDYYEILPIDDTEPANPIRHAVAVFRQHMA